jgi:hypothetical protein
VATPSIRTRSLASADRHHQPAAEPGIAALARDMGVMISLSVIFTLLADIKLRALGPRRRK